jgi:hypothetical protein
MAEVEGTVPTAIEKIRVVQRDETDLLAIERGVRRLAAAVQHGESPTHLVREIISLVPEYHPQRSQLGDVELVRSRSEERRPRGVTIPPDVARLPGMGDSRPAAAQA